VRGRDWIVDLGRCGMEVERALWLGRDSKKERKKKKFVMSRDEKEWEKKIGNEATISSKLEDMRTFEKE